MVIYVTLDSSVIVAALREQEEKHFFDLDLVRADEAANIAKEIGVQGMDAIVIQTAKEFDNILVSLDGEMLKRAKSVVTVKDVEDF
jgi:predicted nucleic acid-binding protein